jgi:hypothetical protein
MFWPGTDVKHARNIKIITLFGNLVSVFSMFWACFCVEHWSMCAVYTVPLWSLHILYLSGMVQGGVGDFPGGSIVNLYCVIFDISTWVAHIWDMAESEHDMICASYLCQTWPTNRKPHLNTLKMKIWFYWWFGMVGNHKTQIEQKRQNVQNCIF